MLFIFNVQSYFLKGKEKLVAIFTGNQHNENEI